MIAGAARLLQTIHLVPMIGRLAFADRGWRSFETAAENIALVFQVAGY